MPMVPLSWLRDHVEIPASVTVPQLAAALVKVGLEEETIHPARVTGPLVVGKVLTREPKEQSNGKVINYCRVDVGQYNDEPGTGKEPSDLPSRGIICGAHNFDVGDLVVVSLPGAVLPGPFEISARKTYGHISDGMICSERELGLGEDHNGILVLTDKFDADQIPAPGSDVIPLLGLGEEVLEINVTPDRGYCFSMRGVAREYSHSTGATLTDPGLPDGLDLPEHSDSALSVEVEDKRPIRAHVGCDRFVTRIVRGVDTHAQTPKWMVERLEMAGMRSISLPVDVTNYIMLDLGQPMHAYDLGSVAAPIVVRRAEKGEHLVTLDGEDRALNDEDLLITDSPQGQHGSRIIGLAGVMGGLDSEITEGTTDLVLEAAHFDSISIARTSRRHFLASEASKRFERGSDPAIPPVAIARACALLEEYGGGQADPHVFEVNTVPEARPIDMKVSETQRLTGLELPPARIRELLETIGCQVHGEDSEAQWQVTPPSWRPDLTGPADLVEEVARLHGYDEIPSILPQAPAGQGLTTAQKTRRDVARVLANAGLTEVESYPFMSTAAHDRQQLAADDPNRQAVRLRNPLADDAPLLRTRILDTLLDVAGRNMSRGMNHIAVFEIAKVVRPAGTVPSDLPSAEQRPSAEVEAQLQAGVPSQPWHVGAILCGNATGNGVFEQPRVYDWADAIDLVWRVAQSLGVKVETARGWLPESTPVHKGPPMPQASSDPHAVAPWHPGRMAQVFVRNGKTLTVVARAGELHPRVCEAFGLPKRSCALELDVDALVAHMAEEPIQVSGVSTFPVAKEDFALVVANDIPVARVAQVIRQAAGALAEEVSLFDIYEGDQVPDGHRSLAFTVKLRADDRTLSADEVTRTRNDIISRTGKTLGAQLRA